MAMGNSGEFQNPAGDKNIKESFDKAGDQSVANLQHASMDKLAPSYVASRSNVVEMLGDPSKPGEQNKWLSKDGDPKTFEARTKELMALPPEKALAQNNEQIKAVTEYIAAIERQIQQFVYAQQTQAQMEAAGRGRMI